MAPLHVHHDGSSLQTHAVGGTVGAFHVLFVFVFDKGKAARLAFLVDNQFQVLYRTELFHFAEQLAFRDLVGQSRYEQGVVAIHALVFTAALALGCAILFDEGSQLFFVLLLLGLDGLGLEDSGNRFDLAFRRFTFLKVFQEIKDASNLFVGTILDGR